MKLQPGILSTTRRADRGLFNITSIIFALFIRQIPNRKIKCAVYLTLGLIYAVMFSGEQAVFILLTSLVTLVWFLFSKFSNTFKSPRIVFVLVIGLRITLDQYSDAFEFQCTATTISMLMNVAVRCISFAFELEEFRNRKTKKQIEDKISPLMIKEEPDVFSVAAYTMAFPAVSIGPMFTFNTFEDSLKRIYENKHYRSFAFTKLLDAIILFVVLYILEYFAPPEMYTNGYFKNINSHMLKLVFMTFTAAISSTRLYVIWRLGECACICAGIGEYPVQAESKCGRGPSKIAKDEDITEYNYDTIYNGRGHLWMFETSPIDVVRNWNTTIQWWLARYCYTTTLIPKHHRALRFIATQIINAIWHGVRPGYFFGFLFSFVILYSERIFASVVRERIHSKPGRLVALATKYITYQWLFITNMVVAMVMPSFEIMKDTVLATYQTSFCIIGFCIFLTFVVEMLSRK